MVGLAATAVAAVADFRFRHRMAAVADRPATELAGCADQLCRYCTWHTLAGKPAPRPAAYRPRTAGARAAGRPADAGAAVAAVLCRLSQPAPFSVAIRLRIVHRQ